jgi:hypothetical protein
MRKKYSLLNLIEEGVDSNVLTMPVVKNTHYYLFAGGTKPYHAGHDAMIKSVIDDAKASPHPNKVVGLFIGLGGRGKEEEMIISGDQVKQLWNTIIEPHLIEYAGAIPLHIEYGGGPVGKVLGVLKAANENPQAGIKVFVYSDPKDTKDNYMTKRFSKRDIKAYPDDPSKWKELGSSPPNIYKDLRLAQPGEAYKPGEEYKDRDVMFMGSVRPDKFERGAGMPDISGTKMRQFGFQNKKESFIEGIPQFIKDDPIKLSSYLKVFGLNEAIKRKNRNDEGYSSYLEEIMNELQHIKKEYGSRTKEGKQYRKEASKIQDAYSEIRRLKRKHERQFSDEAMLSERAIRRATGHDDYEDDSNKPFNRDTIRDFFNKFK